MNILFVLAVIFISLINILPGIECTIRCYKCLATPPTYYTNETIHLCKDFDYSDKFIVDCPYSTFCMKTFTSAKISGLINGTERDCASQKQVIQKYYDGKWHTKVDVEEPYEPGCSIVNDKGARTSTIENCYCNTYLCNSSRTFSQCGIAFVFLAVIALLII